MKALTAIIYPGASKRWLVAYNLGTGTTTQGKTVDEALMYLKETTALFLEEQDLPGQRGASVRITSLSSSALRT